MTLATDHRTLTGARALLRRVLLFDAAASVLLGAVCAAGGARLAGWLGLPAAVPLPLGLVLLAWAGFVAWTATRRPPPDGAVAAVVGLNAVWAVAGIEAAAAGAWQLTPAGRGVVLGQALAVLLLAGAEAWAWRRARPAR